MSSSDIYIKTEAGSDEVRARGRKLAPRLRTMLIMVDGSLTVTQLEAAAATLGAPGDFLQLLLAQGLVRSRQAGPSTLVSQQAARPTGLPVSTLPALANDEPERYRVARKFLNDTAVDALGVRAFFFTLKLEKCSTRADLQLLLAEYERLVTKGSGEAAARVLSARAGELLG